MFAVSRLRNAASTPLSCFTLREYGEPTRSVHSLPRRRPKAQRPTRRAVAFYVTRPDGAVLLRRRPSKGLLGGMMEVPSTPWRPASWAEGEALAEAPVAADWRLLDGLVRHSFTHFHFEVTVWAGRIADGEIGGDGRRWVAPDRLADEALPTVMRKILDHGLKAAGG